MKRLGLILSVAASVLAAVPAMAAAPACRPTSPLTTMNYPGAERIPSGNNLLLPAGKSIPATGQKLLIIGRVLDARCMPVPEAVVELWQANPFGEWVLAAPDDLVTPSPTFAGAGRATTDMDGQFQFITAFPAAVGKRAPNVNVKIRVAGMNSFSTVLYFGGDAHNAADPVYKKLSAAARGDVTLHMGKTDDDDLAATIDIVLPNRVAYRTY